MDEMNRKLAGLTDLEREALLLVARNEGMLISGIPGKRELDCWDNFVPGMPTYKKLIRLDLIFFTEEEPLELEDGTLFDFTPGVYLSEELDKFGRTAVTKFLLDGTPLTPSVPESNLQEIGAR